MRIRAGDTLASIAVREGASEQSLRTLNPSLDLADLAPDHFVKRGR